MAVAIIAGIIIILAGQKSIGKGLILGTIFSVINFVLMAQAIPLRVTPQKRNAILFSLGSIGIRYALLALPLILAIKFEQFNLPAAIVGIFMIQLIILVDHLKKALTTRAKQA